MLGFFQNDTILIFSCSNRIIYFWDIEQQRLLDKYPSTIRLDVKIIFRNNKLILIGYDKAIHILSYKDNRLLLQWCSNPQLNFKGAGVKLSLLDKQTQNLLKELKVCDVDNIIADPSEGKDFSRLSGEENENNLQTNSLSF